MQREKVKATREVFSPTTSMALSQLRSVRFTDGQISYWVMRLARKFDSELKAAQAEFTELMKIHGVTEAMLAPAAKEVKEGQEAQPPVPESFKEAEKAFNTAELDFGIIEKLPLARMNEARLSAAMIEALEPFLDFTEYEAPAAEASGNVTPIKQGGS